MSTSQIFADLPTLAKYLQDELKKDNKRFTFLYGYNGTGKTPLSGAFRDIGKEVNADGETTKRRSAAQTTGQPIEPRKVLVVRTTANAR